MSWIERSGHVWPLEDRMYKQILAEIDSRHAFYTRMCLRVSYYPFACPSVRRVVFPPLCHSPVRRLRARLPLFRELLFATESNRSPWGILETGWEPCKRVARTCPPTQVPDYPRVIRSSMSLQRWGLLRTRAAYLFLGLSPGHSFGTPVPLHVSLP